jgi:hypothetical protein
MSDRLDSGLAGVSSVPGDHTEITTSPAADAPERTFGDTPNFLTSDEYRATRP